MQPTRVLPAVSSESLISVAYGGGAFNIEELEVGRLHVRQPFVEQAQSGIS
jgi:hypothetical protein